MSGNKEALIRYRAINRCLQNRKTATRDQLIDACSDAVGTDVSWRTVASDIHAMRYDEGLKFYAPIVNVKNLGYRYDDPSYSIDNIPLTDRDMDALSFAARLLKQYSSVEIFRQFADAVERLNERVSLPDTNENLAILGFEHGTRDTGSEHLNQLIELIKTGTVAKIAYRSFARDEEKSYLIHPYYLKQYRNRWYLVGRHEESEDIRTFGLDRMIRIEPDYYTTYRPSAFDPGQYYRHAIGVSVLNKKPVEIRLKISSKQAPYVLSMPFHESQQVIEHTDNDLIVSFTVIINYELISAVLSMGSDVEVLSPPELIDQVKGNLTIALKQYKGR